MQVKTQSCVVAGKKTVAVTEQTIDWNNNGTLVQITRGGICGSDLHYYQEGKVGNFMIKAPMVLGHEVIGKVIHSDSSELHEGQTGNDSNLLIVFYVQIMPDDFVMQLHRF